MRLTLFIASMLLMFNTFASHLIGGEVTYEYVTGNQYKVKVTLYRDCNDCKLGNDGGGTSKENCNNLKEAYIRTISDDCQNKNIGSITLTKTGFENITPLCDTSQSACGTNSSYAYGVEAHYYEGLIDFDTYSQYNGCAFHIFFSISERSDKITTLESEEDNLHNYAYINPWKENVSSPSFVRTPKIFFNVNKPVYLSNHTTNESNDSIVYKWVKPLKAHNSFLPYKLGYSMGHFVSTSCPNGNPCTPDPETYPPTGIYLNSHSGDFVFTPTSVNQIAIRVIAAEQWRTHNGTTYKAGEIRRDVLVVIINEDSNHSPEILTKENLDLCLNEKVELEINSRDLHPSTNLSSKDTVKLSFNNLPTGMTVSYDTTSTAPFIKALLHYIPTQVGISSFQIIARDNHCPSYGESIKTVTINVHSRSEIDFSVDTAFCGNNVLKVNTNREASYFLRLSENQNILFKDSFKTGFSYQTDSSRDLSFDIFYADIYGCKDSVKLSHSTLGNQHIETALANGETDLCTGDSLILSLSHNSFELSQIQWKNQTDYVDTLRTIAQNGFVNFSYTMTEDNLSCQLSDSIAIHVTQGPHIQIPKIEPICFIEFLPLEELNAIPSDGQWYYENNKLAKTLDLSRIIPNEDTNLTLRYVASPRGQITCSSTEHVKITFKEKPEMVLANTQVCGGYDTYRLNNSIKRPFSYGNQNISWEILEDPSLLITEPYSELDLNAAGDGIFTVIATNTYENGCIATDTATIKVDSSLVLDFNKRESICQGEEAVILSHFFDVNIEGGLWFVKDDIAFYGEEYTPSDCKNVVFEYFYDKNGCHNQIEIPLKTICQPTFDIDLNTEICDDFENIELDENYTWTLEGNEITRLNPANISRGIHILSLKKQVEGCIFDTAISIDILAPLSFDIIGILDGLCEGQDLSLVFQSENELARGTYAFCKDSISSDNEQEISYSPANCDLVNGKITFKVTSNSEALCPSKIKTYSLPYHPKPEIGLNVPIEGCEPFYLNQELSPKNTSDIKMGWEIVGPSNSYVGTANKLTLATLLQEGNYDVNIELEDQYGCENKQVFEKAIIIQPKPVSSFRMGNTDRLTLSDRDITLYNYSYISQGEFDSEWSLIKTSKETVFSQDLNPIYELPADTGIYTIQLVTLSDQQCSDTSSNTVVMVPDIIAFIPSAFTPDNKGPKPNNVFRVTSDHASSFYMDVFNKWGQKVYHSTNIREYWDGTYNGSFCQNGVYLYSIKLINKSGIEYTYQGTVNLIR